jgi:hypothetical protein
MFVVQHTAGTGSRPVIRTLLYALFALGCLLLLFGCGRQGASIPGQAFYAVSANPYLQNSAERDSIFSVLRTINQEHFRYAFDRLATRNFTRYTRIEQFDRDDYLIAYDEHVVRHGTSGGARTFEVLDVDSAGDFDYGYFSRFVSETIPMQDPPNLAAYILPDEPAYLSERNRDAYLYRFLADTLMWDVVAQVVEIRAKPKDGDGQNVRRVRFYIDRSSKALIGMHMERIDLAMFFREESRFYVHIRRSPDGSWVPYNTRFETRIRVPFRPAQLFRTVSTYFRFEQRI